MRTSATTVAVIAARLFLPSLLCPEFSNICTSREAGARGKTAQSGDEVIILLTDLTFHGYSVVST